MQFCDKLKQLRMQKNISQAKLAEAIFVSRSAIAKWENGLGLPSKESLELLAKYFEVDTCELMSDPVIEESLTDKNCRLSKQGTLIAVLCCLLIVTLSLSTVCVLLFCFNNGTTDNIIDNVIYKRELIFETEKSLDISEYKNYSNEEISIDKEFENSRIFEISYGCAYVKLPNLLIKVTENQVAHYESVLYENICVTSSNNLLVRYQQGDGIVVLPQNYYEAEFIGWVNISYGDLTLSLKVERHMISVDSIFISLDDNTQIIGLTERKLIKANVLPHDAFNDRFEIFIEKIINADGKEINEDLSTYASIDNMYLNVFSTAEIGSHIYLRAVSKMGSLESNTLVVEIVNIPIEKFNLGIKNDATGIECGASSELTLTTFPVNATFNILKHEPKITLLTPEIAKLERIGSNFILTASHDAHDVGKKISISVEIEGITKNFSWEILSIPLDEIKLVNRVTNMELEEVTYLDVNDTLSVYAEILPENATYLRISYQAWNDDIKLRKYFSISDDGILSISSDAPNDLEIKIYVIIDGKKYSKIYKVIVQNMNLVANAN